ncbi:hypothetical protein SLS55_000403 [Diplodia seriata]|uniref:Uncharacterized protein n=1 Tax=Diplodia seriata TaxID=420778 RepID=A0ABR3CU72_9PEZI
MLNEPVFYVHETILKSSNLRRSVKHTESKPKDGRRIKLWTSTETISMISDNDKLSSLLASKIDACHISPETFIKRVVQYCDGVANPLLPVWCTNWVKNHQDELLASEESEGLILKGGRTVKVVADHLTSYQLDLNEKRH